jgi:glutamyl-Q tRNA(Asp) synthetase
VQALFRFAPSPNGYLHLGHAYSALLNQHLAQACDGQVLLRIEDIDQGRTRAQFVEAIFEDLAWLGLRFPQPVRVQSAQFAFYQAQADRLLKKGLLYRCACTRQQISAAALRLNEACDPDGAPLHSRAACSCQGAEAGAPYALRLDMAKALALCPDPLWILCQNEAGERFERRANPALWGDVVLVRKDVPTSYHLAVVLDDAEQKITHVVRGRDLEAATDLHRLLQALLDLPSPLYTHHRLITDEEGQKLAKSKISKPLRTWRAEGVSAEAIRQRLGF